MANTFLIKTLLLGSGVMALSACGLASVPKYTPMEKQTAIELSANNYTPRTAEERESILTQDLFAQAAFWSREYDLNPADLEAAINLASTLRRLGNPGKSIQIAQQTRALYPRDVALMTELGASLVAEHRSRDAIKIIDTALAQQPQNARLWSLKGASLDQLEEYSKARQHYSRALQIAPNDSGILANVGLSYALEGDPKTAEIWLRQAVNMPGANASARQNLALVLGLQGKMDEAEHFTRQDLNTDKTAGNMDYIRSLRGRTIPQRTSNSLAKQSNSQTQYGNPERQSRTYGRKNLSRQVPTPNRPPIALNTPQQQTQQNPNQYKRPQATLQKPNYGMNLTMAGEASALGAVKTASDAARAMARQRQNQTSTGYTTRKPMQQRRPLSQMPTRQQKQTPTVQPQANTQQSVLSKISSANRSKRAIAAQQRAQLMQRASQANGQAQEQRRTIPQQNSQYYSQQQMPKAIPPYGYQAPYGSVQQQYIPQQHVRAPARPRRR